MAQTAAWESGLEALLDRIAQTDKSRFLPGFEFFAGAEERRERAASPAARPLTDAQSHRFLRNLNRSILREAEQGGDFSVLLASRSDEPGPASVSSRKDLHCSGLSAPFSDREPPEAWSSQQAAAVGAARTLKAQLRAPQTRSPAPHRAASPDQFRRVLVDVGLVSRACEERIGHFHRPLRPFAPL